MAKKKPSEMNLIRAIDEFVIKTHGPIILMRHEAMLKLRCTCTQDIIKQTFEGRIPAEQLDATIPGSVVRVRDVTVLVIPGEQTVRLAWAWGCT